MAIKKRSFKSIHEFLHFIDNTPVNKVFEHKTLASQMPTEKGFTLGTYDEAKRLLQTGWQEVSKDMNAKLKQPIANEAKRKAVYGVAGYQAVVPRYLNNMPDSMVRQIIKVQPKPVITIVKSIGYLGQVTSDKITESSLRALQIVMAIEAAGTRVNLDVISYARVYGGESYACRIRIKSADERLNVSKVSFPLAHPDMLRRLVFRAREVDSLITSREWTGGYGGSVYDRQEFKEVLEPTDYYLHNFIDDTAKEIENIKKSMRK